MGHDGTAGFDFNQARPALKVPDEFSVAAMFALGRPGNPDELSAELREIEKPSARRPIKETSCEGEFRF